MRNGKQTSKIPYTRGANGLPQAANYTDPQTFLPFSEANTLLTRSQYSKKPLHGLGISLHNMWGFDIDNCLKYGAYHLGTVDTWAKQYIQAANSTGLISPSGRGVKLMGIGQLDVPQQSLHVKPTRDTSIEFYTGKVRYFTVTTSHLLGTPITLSHTLADGYRVYELVEELRSKLKPQRTYHLVSTQKAEIKTYVDTLPTDSKVHTLIKRLLSYPETKSLWYGDMPAQHNSASEADQALLYRIAWLVGDNPGLIEHIYGLSRRANDKKWHSRADYRARSIEAAITYQLDKRGQARTALHGHTKLDIRTRDALERIVRGYNGFTDAEATITLDIIDWAVMGNPGDVQRYALWEAHIRLWPDKSYNTARMAINRAIKKLEGMALLVVDSKRITYDKNTTYLMVTPDLLSGNLPVAPVKNKGGRPPKSPTVQTGFTGC